ncbi:MAG: phage N-6-adenine-methyltransferase [Oceanisphaera sp.]|uniref:phage N-6-adenine-methyltransferase n=1 Tax=Oceanisphaera sp. TaxID=1929979 RepID=UPI003C710CCC
MSRDSWATPMAVYMSMDLEFDFAGDMCADDTNAKHPFYITEADDALAPSTIERVINLIPSGSYVWINPPYSNTTPWVGLSIQLQASGIGSVMLAMDDSSVGWYWDALQTCNEIREVVKGRIAFINSETRKPVSGNNKGSKFLIFDPYGRPCQPRRTYVERDQLMAEGAEVMEKPELLFPLGATLSSELNATDTDVDTIEPERQKEEFELEIEADPQTRFNPHQLLEQFLSGKLKADHFPTFIAALVVMFGEQDTYHIKQIQAALVAEVEDHSVTIAGLTDYQRDLIGVAGRCMWTYSIVSPDLQVQAVAALVKGGALKENSVQTILNSFGAKFSRDPAPQPS